MNPLAERLTLSDLVLGTDPRLRLRSGLCLLAALMYGCWATIEFMGLQHDLFISEESGQWIIGLNCLAALAFYPLVRSGTTRQWRDPALALPQMILTYVLGAVSYALSPDLRAPILQLMCLVQVFGLFSLSPAQVKVSACCAIGALLLMLSWSIATALPQFDPRQETLCILLACFVLALLNWFSHGLAQTREMVRLQTKDLGKAVDQVNKVLMHDTLTGLFNRRHMHGLLEREYARSRRSAQSHSIALIDLDHFKQINEAYGSLVGDEVLVAFVKIAREVLRETDVIARWGGEEFLLLMPDTNPAQHAEVGLSRLRQALSRQQVSSAAPQLRISFSAGIAIHRPGETLDQALDRADTALQRAKALGRDRSVLAPEPPTISFPSAAPAFHGTPA